MNSRWLNQPQTLDLRARTANKGKTHYGGKECNYSNGDLEYFEGRNLEMGKIIFKNSEDLHVNANIDICIIFIFV